MYVRTFKKTCECAYFKRLLPNAKSCMCERLRKHVNVRMLKRLLSNAKSCICVRLTKHVNVRMLKRPFLNAKSCMLVSFKDLIAYVRIFHTYS